MKALVLGGAGFIGKNLINELKTKFDDILVVDYFVNSDEEHFKRIFPDVKLVNRDITQGAFLIELVSCFLPTHIFHLAANSDIKLASVDPAIDVRNTFMTTVKILEAIPKDLCPVFFFASSSAVYGDAGIRVAENARLNPISSYGWMKYLSEILLTEKAESGILSKLVIFRFPNVVGKHMTHGVIFDLINKLQLNPTTLNVLGDGTQEKPYISGNSLARLINECSTNSEFTSGTFNISPDDRCKVSEIVEMILAETNLSPKIVYSSSREGWKGDVPEYELDTNEIRKAFPNLLLPSSKFSILEAIRSYCEESIS